MSGITGTRITNFKEMEVAIFYLALFLTFLVLTVADMVSERNTSN